MVQVFLFRSICGFWRFCPGCDRPGSPLSCFVGWPRCLDPRVLVAFGCSGTERRGRSLFLFVVDRLAVCGEDAGVQYDGGKGGAGVAQWLINEMPPHRVYIEPFLGGGAVLRLKRPALSSIGVERDAGSVALWSGFSMPGLRVVCGDGISFLRGYRFRGDELVYADPPYLFSTRSSARQIYRCELGADSEHRRLLAVLQRLPCAVMVSGYRSELYASLLSAWRTRSFWTVDRRGRRREEIVWMNFQQPNELHDYRFLGRDFRERERIRRRVGRWRRRLSSLPTLEREALLAAMKIDRCSS